MTDVPDGKGPPGGNSRIKNGKPKKDREVQNKKRGKTSREFFATSSAVAARNKVESHHAENADTESHARVQPRAGTLVTHGLVGLEKGTRKGPERGSAASGTQKGIEESSLP